MRRPDARPGDMQPQSRRSGTSARPSAQSWRSTGVALTVARGELVALLGPSGCGKTTTLRMVAGFEQPDRGEVLIRGAPVTGLPPYRRDMGMVFQSYALFPHMTVADNVAYGLRMRRVPARRAAAPGGGSPGAGPAPGAGRALPPPALGRASSSGSRWPGPS